MTFTFDDQQINLILNVLAARPYGEVFEVIHAIQRQGAQQQQPQLQAVPTEQARGVGDAVTG